MRTTTGQLLKAAVVLMMAACDGVAGPETFESVTAPAYDRSPNALVKLVRTAKPNENETTDWQVISTPGGVLRVGEHELAVPRGAIARPMRFTMTVKHGSHVLVDLSATDVASGEPVTKFKMKLQLKLSYSGVAVTSSEVNKLLVVWLRDDRTDGALIAERTTLQPNNRYVIGWVDHFSQFAMAMD